MAFINLKGIYMGKHDLWNMMSLDIYLSSLTERNYLKVDNEKEFKSFQAMPLLSWDIFSLHYFNKIEAFNREQNIDKIKLLAKKMNWKNDIDKIFDGEYFEALVVTDLHQKIIWVNDGFSEMTGFSRREALKRTPSFLQGPKTSLETKARIHKKLKELHPFTEVIVNYKKNKEPYKCEVKIFPLINEHVTHFIALEKQVL